MKYFYFFIYYHVFYRRRTFTACSFVWLISHQTQLHHFRKLINTFYVSEKNEKHDLRGKKAKSALLEKVQLREENYKMYYICRITIL